MKKYIFFVLLFPILAFSQATAKPGQQFTITGTLKNIKNADYINMNYWINGIQYSETATVKNGLYILKGEINFPQPVTLQIFYKEKKSGSASAEDKTFEIDRKDFANIYIQPGSVSVTSVDSFSNVIVKGTKWNDDYVNYQKLYNKHGEMERSMNKDFPDRNEGPTEERRKEYQSRYLVYVKEVNENLYVPFIKNHTTSPVAFLALTMYSITEKDPEKINGLFELLLPEYKESDEGKFVANKIRGIRNTQLGKMAIDFSLPDSTGKMIALPAYRGKWLLLDFTKNPGGCPPCKEELPFMAKAYSKYKEKGFEILSIDLAMKKYYEESLKDFQKYKEISWAIVFDFMEKGLDMMVFTQYGIQGAPTMFLLDPDGKIVAKEYELRGNELDKTLEKFIK